MTDIPAPVLYTLEDGVATLTLNRPDQLNSLTTAMLKEIPRLLDRAIAESARAVLITGAGRGFCAGAAVGPDGLGEGPDLGAFIDAYYAPLAHALADLPVPLVTAINGAAAGAGASIALAGDIILAARSSYILLAFANIGLVPDAGGTWLVAKAVGRVKAMELALLAEKLPAEDARQAGLITRVVDDASLLDEATAIARRLAAMPTLAMGLIRKQVSAALERPFADIVELERDNQRVAGFSEDHREGFLAFREKRKPVFVGR